MINVYLNELSFGGNVSKPLAIAAMRDFVDCLRGLSGSLQNICLVSEYNLLTENISVDYNFSQWRNHGNNRDEAVYIRRLLDKAPELDLAFGDEGVTEYSANGVRSFGLAAAHTFDGIAVSLGAEALWRSSETMIQKVSVDIQDDGNLIEREEAFSVRNAWNCNLDVHQDWISYSLENAQNAIAAAVMSGAQLDQECVFVDFLPGVLDQIEELTGPCRGQAMMTILLLNRSISEWNQDGLPYPSWRSKITPESQSRINAGLVNFTDRDSQTRAFGLHARFTPGHGRIHFRLDDLERSLVCNFPGRS